MYVTHSALECFKSCRQKYKLRYIQCLVPKETSNSLVFGSAMHEVLEQYFRMIQARNEDDYVEGEADSFKAMMLSVISQMDNLSDIDRSKLTGLAYGYVDMWLEKDWKNYEVVDVEREFNFKITDDVKFAGKVDGILRDKTTGEYFILEHKTASIVDAAYTSQKMIDAQTMTYALAIGDELGVTISGAIHDILIKQKIRQKTNESDADFKDRLISSVNSDNFVRIVVNFNAERLGEFRAELFASCKDLSECNNFYKCTGNCIGRYGACEYLPLCSGDDIKTLAEMYEEKRAHSELSEATTEE